VAVALLGGHDSFAPLARTLHAAWQLQLPAIHAVHAVVGRPCPRLCARPVARRRHRVGQLARHAPLLAGVHRLRAGRIMFAPCRRRRGALAGRDTATTAGPRASGRPACARCRRCRRACHCAAVGPRLTGRSASLRRLHLTSVLGGFRRAGRAGIRLGSARRMAGPRPRSHSAARICARHLQAPPLRAACCHTALGAALRRSLCRRHRVDRRRVQRHRGWHRRAVRNIRNVCCPRSSCRARQRHRICPATRVAGAADPPLRRDAAGRRRRGTACGCSAHGGRMGCWRFSRPVSGLWQLHHRR